jgi:hypothetical protein
MKTLSVITGFVVIVVFFVLFFSLSSKKDTDVQIEGGNVEPTTVINSHKNANTASSQQSNSIHLQLENKNSDAAKLGLETDPELIAEIEQEMQFSEAPEGDLSYMSPEAETSQLLDEKFPGVAPDPHMKMPGNIIVQDEDSIQNIGEPLEKNTKMDDLPLY